jgi:hypothetical protein
VNWPAAATIATPADYPAIAAAITRIIAESATALARWKGARPVTAVEVLLEDPFRYHH